VNLTIVGLGAVGTSLGLALKAATSQIAIVGHDPDSSRVARAKKLGAIDKSHWNLISACEKADLILLDLPLDAIEKTLTALQHELIPGALVIDTCPLKRPVMAWARQILPETVQFVGGHVVLRRWAPGVTEPSADLLQDAVFYLVAPEGATEGALDLASNLAVSLGARPQFIGAVEHDGLVAAASHLPLLAALATVNTVSESAGWRDRATLAGEDLGAVCSVLANMPGASAEALMANADNLLHWLDDYLRALTGLRQLLRDRDRDGLDALLAQAQEASLELLPREGARPPKMPEPGRESVWRNIFLGGLGRRRPE